ncbi:hydroxymethylglutaryl-CoA reductase, degradative [Lactobacillus sp. PV012]|uniref:hydroxymethylglutaryl-CoA reductase, degradative n=1 Tax=Lactobacillus sp. PV012 TaxID=2594494 RepID=UPI00223EDE22|nr:hydroxymethylglutaryl-CoA reductase, degradative [Lactobacillus sp. PV012]QNQ82603.1 hydroxymethylglutaryl-CoA reductase, degradative [Lactobacillus sp. PV012]
MHFYKLDPYQRRELLKEKGIKLVKIEPEKLARLNQLSENVIGEIDLPLGVVQDVVVNNKSYLVPMAVEEPSVVAAANHGAKVFAKNGGSHVVSKREGIYGQIVLKVDQAFSLEKLAKDFPYYVSLANKEFASLVNHGGGVKEITGEIKGDLVYLKVLVDPAQAMGANKTNSILEFLSNKLVRLPHVREKMFAILSNYPSQFATVKVELTVASVGGMQVAKKIALLSKIGYQDPYRAVTNNKGIMNGVDSILIATGNDYRSVEAACGVFASKSGKYRSLSKWEVVDDKLIGSLTLPLALGVVGGSINSRSDIQQAYSILGEQVSSELLASLIVTVGLANNFAALHAISTKGIQAGHMKLQARNLVANLDASSVEKSKVLKEIIKLKHYSQAQAQEILEKVRKQEEDK